MASDVEVAKLFLENGADLHLVDSEGFTPLHTACRYAFLDMVQLLVEHGAGLDVQNNDGLTPLHAACKPFNDGPTKKYFACMSKKEMDSYLEMIEFLVKKGADIHAKDHNGWTPLHWACSENLLEVVKLSRGSSLNAETNEGETPLQLG